MKLNKEIYYHANSGDRLHIGDTLIFDANTKNKMYEDVYYKNFTFDSLDANEVLINKQKLKI